MSNIAKPKLLLHTCCAPCLTSVEARLRHRFDVTAFWYNPNIEPSQEHELRLETFERYTKKLLIPTVVDRSDSNTKWHQTIDKLDGYQTEHENGNRCAACITIRLEECAKFAAEHNFEIFGTTLTVSPHKNSALITLLGEKVSAKYGLSFLADNFKKENGYLQSVELSRKHGLYRQKYCGCSFSLKAR